MSTLFYPVKMGRLHLLYKANRVSLLIQQAGGMAGTARNRRMEAKPTSPHQRIPLRFGSCLVRRKW